MGYGEEHSHLKLIPSSARVNNMKKAFLLLASLLLISTPAYAQRIIQVGTITTAGSDCTVTTNCVILSYPQQLQSIGVRVDIGTTGTFVFEYTVNGTTWQNLPDDVNSAVSTTSSGSFFFSNPGYYQVRVRASAITGSATTITVVAGYAHFRSTATLTGGGGDGAILDGVSAAIKATVFSLTNSHPLAAQIVDSAGTAITSFGGGTQYANNSVQATPTGTVALGWDGANVRALSVNASGQQNVIFPSPQAVTQSGSFTVRNVGNTGAVLDFAGQNAASPANSFLVGAQFNTAPTTLTTGNASPLQLDSAGNLLVNVKAGGAAGGTSSSFGAAIPGTGTAAGFSDSTNMQLARVFDADTGAGTQYLLGTVIRSSASGGSLETFPAPAALADATANPTTSGLANYNMCFNGTTWDRCKSATLGNGTNTTAQLVTVASDSTGQIKATNFPTTVTLNAGAADASTIRTADDLRDIAGNAVSTAASGIQKVGVVGNAGAAVDAATGAAPPANVIATGGLASGATGGFMKIPTVCDTGFVVNISTATTVLAVTGVSGRQVRICSINLVAGAADNVALIEGTGATCGTGSAGMAGGTTAASGWNFAANGGLTLGSGFGEVISTATTGDSVCIVTSAATQLSGHIRYTIF
jgi:hypothetical protein